jgi:hypothetical protein
LVLTFHWYVKPAPVAVTAKFAVDPAITMALLGEVVIEGAVLTVTAATLEFAGAQTPLVTTAR